MKRGTSSIAVLDIRENCFDFLFYMVFSSILSPFPNLSSLFRFRKVLTLVRMFAISCVLCLLLFLLACTYELWLLLISEVSYVKKKEAFYSPTVNMRYISAWIPIPNSFKTICIVHLCQSVTEVIAVPFYFTGVHTPNIWNYSALEACLVAVSITVLSH